MWSHIRYWLFIGHRWLGIAACLLFAAWFVSGLVMTIVGYPELDERARVGALRPIEWARVRVTPQELLSALPIDRFPREFALEMLADEPVYRVRDWDGSRRTISAVEIKNVGEVDEKTAMRIASDYANAPATSSEILHHDQWTVAEGYGAYRPLYKVTIGDEPGTQVYVGKEGGEVALATTRRERFWNWLGSIPHWIYFTEVRANQPLWRQLNLWLSGPPILVAASGFWIGILQLRVRRRYPSGAASPYAGWKHWHHWLGIIGGVFVMTWMLSGWLSVNPNQWLSGGWYNADQALAFAGHRASTFPADASLPSSIPATRVEFLFVAGRPVVQVWAADRQSLLDARSFASVRLSDDELFASIEKALPSFKLAKRERVVEDDLNWYSVHGKRPLPVLRAVFSDPANSWFYIDPNTGQIVDFSDTGGRRYRWWFNALHRWDFSWLLRHKALWYATIWTFALTGLTLSITGMVIGWRRLRRNGKSG